MNEPRTDEIRLNKFLSQSGITSRRKADELISEGKVKINGKTTTALGTKINSLKDKITLEGKDISLKKEFLYIALNKPQGVITTMKDELNRKTVMDILPKELKDKGLKPIGRLDKDTEGLLLLTNDNELINRLTHPKYEKEKEYKVVIEGALRKKEREILEKGVILPEEDTSTHQCKIKILSSSEEETSLTITLKEGRKRQIRKMFQLFGHTVIYLQRIRFGNLTLNTPPLNNMKTGQIKLLNKKCLQA